MGLHAAVCPAFRAEFGSSSSSLYSASFPSSKLPSCRPEPRTLTMYFFCNNAWPVLLASALASTHTHTHPQSLSTHLDLNVLCVNLETVQRVPRTNQIQKGTQHGESVSLRVCSLTYPCPFLSAASQPVDHTRSSFCTLSVPSYDCQSRWRV